MKVFKKIIPLILALTLVALLAALPLITGGKSSSSVRILSQRVRSGRIVTTVAGGGTLTEEPEVEVSVPSGVEISRFLVSNGDMVEEGAPLAEVDRVSVMRAVTETQKTLDDLNRELERNSTGQTTANLTAPASGRVKAVYAQAGDDVRDVMLAYGALAVVSLDGLMALEFETEGPAAAGDRVTVRLSGDTEYAGRVETSMNGHVVVTLTDDGPAFNADATVISADGEMLGSGRLYAHSAWNAVSVDGTAAAVNVREEGKVNAGAVLFRLTDSGESPERQRLADRHREYEAILRELFLLNQYGTVPAPCAGYVSGIGGTKEDAEGTTILSVTPDHTMQVTITVDELDILQFRPGMPADVTIEALPGQSFTGTVTEIGNEGVNSGGNSKFGVTLSLDRSPEMLAGMTASVIIDCGSTDEVLTIPAAALNGEGTTCFVFTEYNEKIGEPAAPVNVITGASDGEIVEILSGLAEGMDVWYAVYELSKDFPFEK